MVILTCFFHLLDQYLHLCWIFNKVKYSTKVGVSRQPTHPPIQCRLTGIQYEILNTPTFITYIYLLVSIAQNNVILAYSKFSIIRV